MEEKSNEIAEFDVFFEKFKGFIEEQNKQKKTTNDYNVITSLLSKSDEVRLHSRFIYSLINPNGRHYRGSFFLKIFLETIGINDFIYKNAEVKKEYENIDLYITDGLQHIIIENKIYAYDQNKQISRYIKIINNKVVEDDVYEKITVVYLTLEKRIPSKSSLNEWCIDGECLYNGKNRVKFINVTYRLHVLNWLKTLLLNNNELHENIKQSIKIYEEVVAKITNTRRSNIMGADEYLLKNENFDSLLVAASLSETFKNIKGRLLKQFFKNIDESVIENKCAIKYSDDDIKDYSYEHNNCNQWFIGRPRNYNIGTFFKIENMPVIFGILVSKEMLYFVVRIIGDNENIDKILKDANILSSDDYKYWSLKKNTNKQEIKLNFYCLPLNFNIYSNINKREILSLLCEKKSAEKIVEEKFRCFVNSLNSIKIYNEQ